MRMLLALFALILSAPTFATYGNGAVSSHHNNVVVNQHEQIVVDCYMDVTSGHYDDTMSNIVAFANAYANQRQVVVNVIGHNDVKVVKVRQANFRQAVRKNVRVVFARANQRLKNRNQVQVVVRAQRRLLFNGLFRNGFNRAARARANQAVVVKVRG